jgi:hypothetical protein
MCPTIECPSCSSKNQHKLNGELALHFPGIRGLHKPIIWAFPKVLVCLDCGIAVLALEDEPLKEVRKLYKDDELPDSDNLVRAV